MTNFERADLILKVIESNKVNLSANEKQRLQTYLINLVLG